MASVLRESVALPEESSVPVPIEVVPSTKVTVPVGVPPTAVTDAVKVVGFGANTGFALEVRAMAEAGPTAYSHRSLNIPVGELLEPEPPKIHRWPFLSAQPTPPVWLPGMFPAAKTSNAP